MKHRGRVRRIVVAGIEAVFSRRITYTLSFILSVVPLLALAVWIQKQVFGVISVPYTGYLLLALTVTGLAFWRLTVWMRKKDEMTLARENARLSEDLTRLQELLVRSDRLAAVGTLAAGIAHEIRNPLVSLYTFTQLLPERLDDPEFRTTFLQLATREVARVCTLIDNLMDFARPALAAAREVDLNAVLEQVVQLLSGQARKKGIRLSFSPSSLLPPVPADEGHIKQVFMNLLLNALEATAAGGTVVVATQTWRSQGGKEYCQVEVRDTGEGIPAEYQERIFTPFFTTKDSGTGLGLFIVQQIVAGYGGYVTVESSVGQGTSFYVYLPRMHKQELGEASASEGSERAQASGEDFEKAARPKREWDSLLSPLPRGREDKTQLFSHYAETVVYSVDGEGRSLRRLRWR